MVRAVVNDDQSVVLAVARTADGCKAQLHVFESVMNADDDIDLAVLLRGNPFIPNVRVGRPRIGIDERNLKGVDERDRQTSTGIVRHKIEHRVVPRTVRMLHQLVPLDPGLFERIIQAQLVALAVAIDFRPPEIQKRPDTPVPQVEHHQIALYQIPVVETGLPVMGDLFLHRFRIFLLSLDAGFQFLINGFPLGMGDSRDSFGGRQEFFNEGMNIPLNYNVGVDPDRDIVILQQHMGMGLHEPGYTGLVFMEICNRPDLPHGRIRCRRIRKKDIVETAIQLLRQLNGIVTA